MNKQGKIFIISGPSGAGKTTLVTAVLERVTPLYKVERVVTVTTKQPRAGEIPGQDYTYISVDEFEQSMEQGLFLEVTKGLGHYYGTPRSVLDKVDQGISQVLVIDQAGAKELISYFPDAILIWIETRNIEMLRTRLVLRKSETHEQIQKRIDRAENEMQQEHREKFYHHHIINDDLKAALDVLEDIIMNHLQ